jgi:lon-related putative ATP-dependent protease
VQKPLEPEKLRALCCSESFEFTKTNELSPLSGIIGQEQATRSLEFGLSITQSGYNIYVSGTPGSGRTTSVEYAVKEMASAQAQPDDWCYVWNFSAPDNPKALRLPPGKGRIFREDMDAMVNELQEKVPKSFEEKQYEEEKTRILKEFQKIKEETFNQIEKKAQQSSLIFAAGPEGFRFLPAVDGKPLSDKDMEKLTDEAKKDIRKKQEVLFEHLTSTLRELRQKEKSVRNQLMELDRRTAKILVTPIIGDLKEKYAENPGILSYLNEAENHIIQNIDDFHEKKESPEILPGLKIPSGDNPLLIYKVNVFIDNAENGGAPVIKENNPTAANLSGRIEYRPALGAMFTDFTMLKPGALHLANGGYLILHALDVLKSPFAWETLKRAIKNKELRIEDLNEQFRIINTPTIKPEPIPANLKIILIGNIALYHLLYAYEEEFRKLFKVRVDFSALMDRNQQGIAEYAAFVNKICTEEELKTFDCEAVGKIVEFGSRVAEDQTKLSTRFLEISDLIKESDYWASREGVSTVSSRHVMQAAEEKVYRSNLIERRIRELIAEGTFILDTEGEKTGQVNGLAVLSMGDYAFGKPSRITVAVAPGKSGIINIEREVKMAGAIHNKGFLILKGLFSEKFGTGYPLSFTATCCFEQTYEEIDGDSASSTEFYALISALSQIPINQGIAVTGSINQKGEIQPIGGANEKVEGFFETCKAKGLTGSQGVIIPRRNVKNLMLKEEVIEAVRKGLFSIWDVATVDEGIEILTNRPAGKIEPDGTYPKGTVYHAVGKRLQEYEKIEKKKTTSRKKDS